MNCQPIATDTPGIFRCTVCGLQNPRPIAKPFIAQCGPYEPPEPPYDAESAEWILATLCPGQPPCPRHEAGKCRPDPESKCQGGLEIATMIQGGMCCPLRKF